MGGSGDNYFNNSENINPSQSTDNSGYANLQKDSQESPTGFKHLDKNMLQQFKNESDEQYIGRLGQMVKSCQDMLYSGRQSELTREDVTVKNEAQKKISEYEKTAQYKSKPAENTNKPPLQGNVELKALQGAKYDNSNQPQNKPPEVQKQQPPYRPGSKGEFVPQFNPQITKSDGINTNPYPPFYGDARTQKTFNDTPGDPSKVDGGYFEPVFDNRGRQIPVGRQARDWKGQVGWRPEPGHIPYAEVPPPGAYMRSKYGNPQTPIPNSNDSQQYNGRQAPREGYVNRQAPAAFDNSSIRGRSYAQPDGKIPVLDAEERIIGKLPPHPNAFTAEELAAAHRNGMQEKYDAQGNIAFMRVPQQSEVQSAPPAYYQNNDYQGNNYQDSRNNGYQDSRNYYNNRPHGIGQTINNLGNNLYGARRTINQGRNLLRQVTGGGRGFRF